MAQTEWDTGRKTDAAILASLERIASAVGTGENWSINVALLRGQTPPIVNGVWATVKKTQPFLELLATNDALASNWNASFPPIASSNLQINRKPEYNDHLVLTVGDNQNATQYIKFLIAVRAEFPAFLNLDAVEKILGREVAEFYRAREAGLLRLEGVSQSLIESTNQYRINLDTQHDERRTKLEAEIQAQQDQLRHDEGERAAALDKRAAELDAERQNLDDRENRHARRALRQDLQKELAERSKTFSLTKDTSSKRWPIHVLFIAALAFDTALTAASLISAEGHPESWQGPAKVAACILAATIILILYIRWADTWFRQHANEEFRLKRMSLDIDRASWVVETAMEWQQQNGAPIPAQLLEELSRGLFTGQGEFSAIRHPVEDLASAVMGASSSLELDLPGLGKAIVGRRGLKKIKNAMDESSQDARE